MVYTKLWNCLVIGQGFSVRAGLLYYSVVCSSQAN